MSSLERVVERLVEVRFVECPRCKLEGKTVRVTVKKRKGEYCKTARCPAGHRINVAFRRQYTETVTVKSPFEYEKLEPSWEPLPQIPVRSK